MPLVLQYRWLKKAVAKGGQLKPFSAERAVGLAVEQGHKFAKKQGLGKLTPESLPPLELTGRLEVFNGEKWTQPRSCNLVPKDPEAKLAVEIVQKQRAFVSDMHANIHYIDTKMPGSSKGALDLICDFSTKRDYGIPGRLWVELKFFSAAGLAQKISSEETKLSKVFPQVQRADSTIEGVLLLVASAEKLAGSSWGKLRLIAKLYESGKGWCDLTTKGSMKPGVTLVDVWKQVKWWRPDCAAGGDRAALDDFLRAVGSPVGHGGRDAAKFNSLLASKGISERLKIVKLRGRPGSTPWSGTKSVLRCIYKHM